METQEILDYEIALLLAKHGGKRVIAALAPRLDLSEGELQAKLQDLRNARPRSAQRKRVDPYRAVDALVAEHPERAASLRLLFTRFQSHSFLPELKDVKRFFDRHSHPLGKVKSRAEAAPKLFRLLSELGTDELAILCDTTGQERHSSLGVISDEILRRHG